MQAICFQLWLKSWSITQSVLLKAYVGEELILVSYKQTDARYSENIHRLSLNVMYFEAME